ncbi:hypothetical protein GCM10010964_42630 [Caldovatus sediminis]|uniref:Alkaline phosphatase family protein n=1 Tax=Caldovatus sediminis TaxID=2041189 RepID=A0A8J2ZFX3_9PROT|nr:alkaline phosphatase family protein [Caldovatus sediminis]GGG50816.1 hypothetical protein GCM10010964_42630 [Caldovatus sediminis]
MRFIVLVLDGLRPDLVVPATMPHLARLAAAGARFARARSVFPSETRVACASLATGSRPGAHGLAANTLFDAGVLPDRLLRTAEAGDLALLVPPGGDSPLGRPTLGVRLAAAGRRLAVVSGGTSGSAFLLFPEAERLGGFRWNVADTAGAAAARVRARCGPTPPQAVPNAARVVFLGRVLTELVLPELRPDVALLWCPEPDLSGHYLGLGAGATREVALRAADDLVGRVAAWRDAQPDAAEIGLVVLSDHGMVTGPRKVSLAEALRRAGFRAGTSLDAGADVVVAPGAAPGLWLRDAAALAGPVAGFLAAQPWTAALLARDPAALGLADALPLALFGAAHPRAPDLMLAFAGEEAPDPGGLPGTAPFDVADVPEGGAMHGGLHRRELATVLLMQGGPFRRGAVVQGAADLSDLAPTLLHLLGTAAEGMEGRVLRAAWDGAADAPPERETRALPRGFALELMRQEGRRYPTALTRAV